MRVRSIVLIVLAGIAVLLALNTLVLDRETRKAEVTVKGAEIVRLPGGDLQVLDGGEPADAEVSNRPGGPGAQPPIVLLHGFGCSINWWDRLTPLLERGGHRVVAIDLLGHGGSEKPRSGYSMENQAQLVAQVLNGLGVEGATVVGHSMGGNVAVALADQSSELVDRLVIVDQAPDKSYQDQELLAKLATTPVIGEAMKRLAPDFAIRDGLGQAFAPGYDVPDQFVDDFKRMTYSSFDSSDSEADSYTGDRPLDDRIRAAFVPLLVVFGSEDQFYDARESLSAYADVPGARTVMIEGSGHSPQVEKPAQTAALILRFAKPAPAPAKKPQEPEAKNAGKPDAGKPEQAKKSERQKQAASGSR
jgi:pimeloyl-ACP methyl ester carboxylesterase